MKTAEDLLQQYDCKVIDDTVYFELKYAANAMPQYAAQYKADNDRLREALYAIQDMLDKCGTIDSDWLVTQISKALNPKEKEV